MCERQSRKYEYDPHLDPQLVWAGKAERTRFEVDEVSLHIHERISTCAILDTVRRPQRPQLELFGETPLLAVEAGGVLPARGRQGESPDHDSLLVMNLPLVKEGVAGKVQMIYTCSSQSWCMRSAELVRNMRSGNVKRTVREDRFILTIMDQPATEEESNVR